MDKNQVVRKTPKPKQLGVSTEVKEEIDLLCDLKGLDQPSLMAEIWAKWKQENPKQWKQLRDYQKLKDAMK